MTELKEYLKEYLEKKIEECQKLSDFWYNKYLITDNPKHKSEYRQYQGKEEAYYDILQTLERKYE